LKKCIILSGHYRTFDQTCDNIKKFIDINELDVYCHLWLTHEYEQQNIIDKLNPKKILVEDWRNYQQIFFEMEKRILQANPKPLSIDKISGNASMNFSRKQAFDLIDQEYDELVYCRYDVNFTQVFKFEEINTILTPLQESYNLISDIFAIMPFKYAKYYFIYDKYEQLHSTQFEPEFEDYLRNVRFYGENNIKIHKDQRYCPHMMLLRNIFNNNVPQLTTEKLSVFLQK